MAVNELAKKAGEVKPEGKTSNRLEISEQFYSIQCEGPTTGVPAYFIRLKACNLMCGGTNGELMKKGEATWWCDTEAVWRAGFGVPFYKLVQRWEQEGLRDWIETGRIHLVWTGGEPTIPKHQKAISTFLDYFNNLTDGASYCTYNEIETNGTIPLTEGLFERMQQINCSPKLANSGMSAARRINPVAIESIMQHENFWFKFVISNESDIEEIENDFIQPFNIPPQRVILMPGLDKQENYHERTRFCLETAKKHGYIGLSRLHISAWNQTTGV
jgi:7-carboxy-7-deazaguanine synthase